MPPARDGHYPAAGDADTFRPREEDVLHVPGLEPPAAGPDSGRAAGPRRPPASNQQATQPARPPGKKSGIGGLKSKQFGKYRIVREIARGGMGIVYLAEDPDLRRAIALKVLIAGEGADERAIKRFLREARASSALKHAHIVPVHEAGVIDGQHFFTMDFIEGKELGDIFARLSLRQRFRMMYQVCKALHYAHEHGVIHRDLKPSNIMVDRHGHPFVMDFGLAKDLSSTSLQSMTGAVMGTPAYMSPEQAKGQTKDIDRRTDIYSLGAIFYQLATGELAFSGSTMYDTMFQVVNKDPPAPHTLNADIDPGLEAIILRCLEKRRDDRYPDCREVGEDLLRWLERTGPRARLPAAHKRLARQLRGNAALRYGLVAAGPALAVLLLVWWLFAGDRFLERLVTDIDRGGNAAAAALSLLQGEIASGSYGDDDTRQRLQPLLLARIGGDSADAEQRAADLLARFAVAAAVPRLVAVAGDPQMPEGRRLAALNALVRFADADMPVPADQDPILAAMLREPPPVPDQLLSALPVLVVERERRQRLVQPILDDEAGPSARRVLAVEIAARDLRLQDRMMYELMNLAADPDPAVAKAAEEAVNGSRDRGSVYDLYGLGGKVGAVAGTATRLQRTVAERNRQLEELARQVGEDVGGQGRERPDQAPPDPTVAMIARLEAPEATTRLAATFDLGNHGDTRASGPLAARLGDDDGRVRKGAARALTRLAGRHEIDHGPIVAMLGSRQPAARAAAAGVVADLGAVDAAGPLVAALEAEVVPATARAQVAALGRLAVPDTLPALARALERSPDELGSAVVAALARREAWNGAARAPLVEVLGHRDQRLRQEALTALQALSGETWTKPELWRHWAGLD